MIAKFINKLIVNFLIIIIKLYQFFISPILASNCRFMPTCSQYCIESLQKQGLIKGSYFSIKRILSCHPFGKYGYDPVPKNNREN